MTTHGIQILMWLCSHGKLPTTSQLNSRGLTTSNRSVAGARTWGKTLIMSSDLVLQQYAFGIYQCVPPSKNASFSLPIHDWIKLDFGAYERHDHNVHWAIIFPSGYLGLVGESVIFPSSKIGKPTQMLLHYARKGQESSLLWRPRQGDTDPDWDGSTFGQPGRAGVGGVLQADDGNWIRGSARGLGNSEHFIGRIFGQQGMHYCLPATFITTPLYCRWTQD